MTTIDFESICLRFCSGNSVPIDMARVTGQELDGLLVYLDNHLKMVDRRISLSKTLGKDVSTFEKDFSLLTLTDAPRAKTALMSALERRDGRVKRREIIGVLNLIWRCKSMSATIKMINNAIFGTDINRIYHTN